MTNKCFLLNQLHNQPSIYHVTTNKLLYFQTLTYDQTQHRKLTLDTQSKCQAIA